MCKKGKLRESEIRDIWGDNYLDDDEEADELYKDMYKKKL